MTPLPNVVVTLTDSDSARTARVVVTPCHGTEVGIAWEHRTDAGPAELRVEVRPCAARDHDRCVTSSSVTLLGDALTAISAGVLVLRNRLEGNTAAVQELERIDDAAARGVAAFRLLAL